LHCVVVSPYYKDGTNTGTPAGRNECHSRKDRSQKGAEITTIQKKMDANQEKMYDGQEEMKAQVVYLSFQLDVNQEEMRPCWMPV
jgi:hypothetical protein